MKETSQQPQICPICFMFCGALQLPKVVP